MQKGHAEHLSPPPKCCWLQRLAFQHPYFMQSRCSPGRSSSFFAFITNRWENKTGLRTRFLEMFHDV